MVVPARGRAGRYMTARPLGGIPPIGTADAGARRGRRTACRADAVESTHRAGTRSPAVGRRSEHLIARSLSSTRIGTLRFGFAAPRGRPTAAPSPSSGALTIMCRQRGNLGRGQTRPPALIGAPPPPGAGDDARTPAPRRMGVTATHCLHSDGDPRSRQRRRIHSGKHRNVVRNYTAKSRLPHGVGPAHRHRDPPATTPTTGTPTIKVAYPGAWPRPSIATISPHYSDPCLSRVPPQRPASGGRHVRGLSRSDRAAAKRPPRRQPTPAAAPADVIGLSWRGAASGREEPRALMYIVDHAPRRPSAGRSGPNGTSSTEHVDLYSAGRTLAAGLSWAPLVSGRTTSHVDIGEPESVDVRCDGEDDRDPAGPPDAAPGDSTGGGAERPPRRRRHRCGGPASAGSVSALLSVGRAGRPRQTSERSLTRHAPRRRDDHRTVRNTADGSWT